MANIQSISTNLLKTELPNEHVTALVYHHADLKDTNLVLASPLPATMALASARDDGWQAAAMQAMSATDVDVITSLARDQRVRVRAALARNPHLPPEVAEELWAWAYAHPGDEVRLSRQALIDTIDILWFSQNALGEPLDDGSWAKIARRAVASEQAEVYEAFAQNPHGAALSHFVAQLSRYRGNPPYSVTAIADFIDRGPNTHWLTKAATLTGTLSGELAALFIAHGAEIPTGLPTVTNEALDIVLAAAKQNDDTCKQLESVLTSMLTTEQIDHALQGIAEQSTNFVKAFKGLLVCRGRTQVRVNAEQLETITEALERCRVQYRAYEFLMSLRNAGTKIAYTPTPESMYRLMCNGDVHNLQAWVSGSMPSEPRPIDIRRILDGAHRSTLTNSEIGSLMAQVNFTLNYEWIDMIVDAAGHRFFSTLSNKQACEYLVARITRTIGDSPRAWASLWTALSETEVSLETAFENTRNALSQ